MLFPASPDGRIMRKRYLDESLGRVSGDVWNNISQLRGATGESLGYPTQKPQALLERIINASSNPGDVVLDGFCGCGTTITAAHKLGREWLGVDVSSVAIAIIKTRLETSFDDLKGKVPVDGFPTDVEGAMQLFEIDSHRFQVWACTVIEAYPLEKKGADHGIDGWLKFFDLDDTPQRAVVQVKGGKVQVSQIRDFCHVVAREKAAIGFFLCMGHVTKPMQDEALRQGYWTDAGGRDYPVIQILSIPDLLNKAARALYPSQDKVSVLGYKAAKQKRAGAQADMTKDLFTE